VCDASTKTLITFGTHPAVLGDEYLDGLCHAAPHVVIAGGMASPPPGDDRGFVFANDRVIESGAVAVGLSGSWLRATNHCSMNWQSLSKRLTVTRARKNLILELDGRPAAEAFHRYLDASDDREIAFLGKLFPLLALRGGATLARGIIGVGADGALVTNGALMEGEQVRFGVADNAAMHGAAGALRDELRQNPPQAVFCYSCVGRLRFAKEAVLRELESLTRAAPTAGFFSAGEFYGTGEQTIYHNFTLTALSLTEDVETIRPQRSSPVAETLAGPMPLEALRFKALHHLARVTAHELEEVNQALRRQAVSDPLTGAYNRRGFMDRFSVEVERCTRHGFRMLLAVLDIDHFKRVNDEHGHRCGDMALQQVVTTAQRCFRRTDVVGRLGGEEFAVLMSEISGVEATASLDHFREEIGRLDAWCAHSQELHLTVSIGVTAWTPGEDWDAVFGRADAAMYRAKAAGRDCIVSDDGAGRSSRGDDDLC
jgi:diguanylate cyclase (GGDEF)-like protein